MTRWNEQHEAALRRARMDRDELHASENDLWGQEARDRARKEISELKAKGKYFNIDAPKETSQ
jgi:hypothetical protein